MGKYFKFILVFAVAFFTQKKGQSQIVKFIKNAVAAKYRVYITQNKREATHLIFRVSSPSEIRKAGHWYVVSNPILFKNSITLYEVKKKSNADIVVFYVSNPDSASIHIK